MTQLLDKIHREKLFWWGTLLIFALFSFNSLATSLTGALVGTKWELLSNQEKFTKMMAIAANWTGLIIVFMQRGLGRLAAGKPPIETGDTEHLVKA